MNDKQIQKEKKNMAKLWNTRNKLSTKETEVRNEQWKGIWNGQLKMRNKSRLRNETENT